MFSWEQNPGILIVGLGVMGGSYAQALTARGFSVSCITKNEEDIAYALAQGMITCGSTEADPDLIGKADLVVFALYPHIFLDWIEKYQKHFKPGALLTDVTGVKSEVVGKVQEMLRPDIEFIAAHPMAGRERSGVTCSDCRVFIGANYIVTPTEKNTPAAIEACKELGRLLGCAQISELTVTQHDAMIAFLSQLTHIIACTLMTCNSSPHLEKYTGDSFRDLTRIAKINDEMWSELFLLNKEALLGQMDRFEAEFHRFREWLAAGNREEMRAEMRAAAARRAGFDKPAF